jgi:pimeloyl-ACP methyl ester carboxylesterase
LALWAAYPAESVDLSDNELAVLSIYGTRDGLTSAADIDASRRRLPEDTRWIAIDGGNHAQFGSYGEQSGDNPAEISREEQQAQIISATLELLQSLSEPQ